MTVPRRLLQSRLDVPLFDDATTRRIERRAAAALPPHELMARAGVALLRLARAVAPHARRVWIAAGPGNNGGDGLVLATWLHRAGVDVSVNLVGHAGRTLPPDAAWALAQARDAGVSLRGDLPGASGCGRADLCVDALLGVGQTRAPEGPLAAAGTRRRHPCCASTRPPACSPAPVPRRARWSAPRTR
jgi:NAD(P)H-hydrate repair Nnr-like enzyme with NAD(P)H-hydrate epimerase domain